MTKGEFSWCPCCYQHRKQHKAYVEYIYIKFWRQP